MLHRIALLALLLLLVAAPSAARGQQQEMAVASLLADVASIQPGTPFTLGLLLEIEPGWHTYWKNPGDSGAATSVQLQLPEGFEASELAFPVPVRFDTADGTNYGYHGSVLHTIRVTPPADLKTGQDVTLEVKAKWLVCEQVCLPGGKTLAISLPVSDAAPAPANEKLFAEWSAGVPVRAEESADVQRVEAAADGPTPVVSIEWTEQVKEIAVFPGKEDALEMSFRVDHDGRTSRIALEARIGPGERLKADALPVVVAYTDADGKRRGVEIEFSLASLKAPAEQADAKK